MKTTKEYIYYRRDFLGDIFYRSLGDVVETFFEDIGWQLCSFKPHQIPLDNGFWTIIPEEEVVLNGVTL